MDESDYLKSRLEAQISWYDSNSDKNKRRFIGFRCTEIAAAVTVPILIGYIARFGPWLELVAGFLSLLVALIAGLLALFRFQEIWIQYRSTCETLRHEKYLFLTKAEPYNCDEPFPLLVRRTEALISKEHTAWSQFIRSTHREDTNG
jgi:hypothetical protein